VAPAPDAETRDGNGDTIYLAVVDKDGNAVSMIQSLFAAFGSGRMVPGTGITLHNRGSLFELDSGHPNVIAPGKRPFHTLSPAMALNPDGSLAMAFGTPGGDGQPQTLVQILNNVLRFGMTPQQAVEASRWRVFAGGRLGVEPGIDLATRHAPASGTRRPAAGAERRVRRRPDDRDPLVRRAHDRGRSATGSLRGGVVGLTAPGRHRASPYG
jgi:gamma-glutamyltranspeptidase/glutathione hydrolase